MNYLTKAGVKLINEGGTKKPNSRKPRSFGGRLISLPIPQKTNSEADTNLSKNNPGHEERMKGHMARIAAKERLDKKMGRDVSEGFKNWLSRKKKPSKPIKLSKRSSAADRGQGRKEDPHTGKSTTGESGLADQTTDIDNTRANRKAIDNLGEAIFKIISPSKGKAPRLLRTSRPVIKKTLANVPIGQSSQGDGGSGLH